MRFLGIRFTLLLADAVTIAAGGRGGRAKSFAGTGHTSWFATRATRRAPHHEDGGQARSEKAPAAATQHSATHYHLEIRIAGDQPHRQRTRASANTSESDFRDGNPPMKLRTMVRTA
jgi:hypothetical protein